MYYDYLIDKAIKNNELKKFLIGDNGYKEKETNYSDNMPIDYEARLRYICEFQASNKAEFDAKIAELIKELLGEEYAHFHAGLCYVRSMCYLSEEDIKLQIDELKFFSDVKNIIKRREKELRSNTINNSPFNNAWDLVEYNNDVIKETKGLSII